MTEIDADPVALKKSSHPLARRPLLAAVAVCSVLLIGAIAMARSGAEQVAEESEANDEPIAPRTGGPGRRRGDPRHAKGRSAPLRAVPRWTRPRDAALRAAPRSNREDPRRGAARASPRRPLENRVPDGDLLSSAPGGAHPRAVRGTRSRLPGMARSQRPDRRAATNRSTRRRPTSSATAPKNGPTAPSKKAGRNPSHPMSSRPVRSFQRP